MGRPLNKKYFGTGAGNQLKVRAKIGTNAEGDGSIVRQRGTNRYEVKVGANKGVCVVVDKADGALAAGEMTVSVKDSTGAIKQVKNIKGHTLVLDTGEIVAWGFGEATPGKVKIADADGGLTSVITAGAATASVNPVTAPAPVTFSTTATVTGGATLSYQWQRKVGAAAFANIAGATSSSYTLANSTGNTGNQFRCVVSGTNGATTVNTTAVTLTVN
jgi:hypothetical protein